MSVADVIGIISGIIAIIDATVKVYAAVIDASGLLEAFHDVAKRLPLVQETLKTAREHLDVAKPDEAFCIAMKPVLEDCADKAKRLTVIFEKVVPQAHASRMERAYCSYITKHNVSCEYRALNAIRTFWTKEGLDQILSKVERLKKENPEVGATIEFVTDQARLSALGVQEGCVGALVNRAGATVWPYKLVMHMIRSLVEAGSVNLQTNTPVERILRDQDGKWSLHTSRGTIKALHVILATNAHTSHLLHDFAPLIVPARGYVTALIPPPQAKTPPDPIQNSFALIAYSPKAGGDLDEDDYLVQRPYSPGPNHKMHLIFGGGHYDGKLPSIGPETADDSIVDPDAVAYLRKAILKAVKLPGDVEGLNELEAEYVWAGIMGYSRDNKPWVGEMPGMKGLFIAAGYTGHGLPNGPMCAKAVVEMILDGRSGKEIVDAGKLPKDYLLTEERMREAMKLPSLIEDDVNPKGHSEL